MALTDEQRTELRELGTLLKRFIGSALIIAPKTDTPKDVVGNGTFSYVDTGEQKLLVTCAHVFDEFKAAKDEDPSTVLGWGLVDGGPPTILKGIEPLDHDRATIDVCTFKAEVVGGIEAVGRNWVRPAKWPVDRVEVGDLVIGVGFPGRHRRIETRDGKEALVMVMSFIAAPVSSVSERHFVLADEAADRWSAQLDPERKYGVSWGGMSGGVFFKVLEENHYELAGFLYEGEADEKRAKAKTAPATRTSCAPTCT